MVKGFPPPRHLGARLIMCLHGSAFTLTEISQPFPIHLTIYTLLPVPRGPQPSSLPYCWIRRIVSRCASPNQTSAGMGRGMFRSRSVRIFCDLHGCIIPTWILEEYSYLSISSSHHIAEYFHLPIHLPVMVQGSWLPLSPL